MDLLAKLDELGFTEYEAKVYLALLDDYPASGYQISKGAGVPRSMVYEALGRLKMRGAVLETPGERATLYRPLPPDVLLDNHELAQRRLVAELRAGLAGLYQGREEDRVWSIHGREALLAYARELIRQAQREVYLVLDDPDVAALQDEIVAACQRGVQASAVLTGEALVQCSQIVRHPPLESQLHELSGTLVVVVDGQEVLVAAGSGEREMTATITRNRNLVLIVRQFVWMELFAQRIFAHLDSELLSRLDPADRRVFESVGGEPRGNLRNDDHNT
jgi:HTH-type transcriptional regulator, sugar sensing transcriptional regulator